ncbi:NUDIX hydrolase [Actinotignum urinale]|uniref:NUDIX hydrolase n=1 Tax=Actinotignum urinale TaxID=190146 RepID=A0AAW9HKM5_9ACTO|nr:NUDIX hydrolase [Actinotignum urinale]MDY5128914.1 NUDIX hydrolase [Actinotignum urinale]MDY5133129.1 NUDIX hydrolase [Actinotignum urinale]MDY5152312.1 NUDIX hydrolase [Actinotignum urinale]MDY5154461.1 NUDIX hydrolase [Actinotignum urinale]WIK59039.1 NUDIX hydrolase [Actinotignum urinale]
MSTYPELRDVVAHEHVTVTSSHEMLTTPFISVVNEEFVLGNTGLSIGRFIVHHDDAVAVLALRRRDGAEEVLLIRQYRHAVGRMMWEIPAGLLDVDGENADKAALRELREETDYEAREADFLVSFYTSPGFTDEKITCFLVRDPEQCSTVFERTDEESEIETYWVPLKEVVDAIHAGNMCCPTLVTSVLAYVSRYGVCS